MPLLLYGADFVMTQRWGHRAKLDGELTQAHPRLTRASSVATPLLPTFSSPLEATASSQQLTAERKSTRFRANAFPQVRTLLGRYAIVLLTTLVLIPQQAMGKPWSNEQPDHVIFRSQICQPLSSTNLKMLMGPNFDDNKMASDSATAKKMFGSATDDQHDDGYQRDDPRVDLNDDDTTAGGEERQWRSEDDAWVEEEENVHKGNGLVEETTHNKEHLEGRSWLPRRKVLNRHVDNRVNNKKISKGRENDEDTLADNSENKRQVGDSYTYMRRRRRSSGDRETQSPARDQANDDTVNDDDRDNEEEANGNDGEIDAKYKKSTNSIQLQLFLSGKDKKQRKKLKKKLRQKPETLSKPPPWECKFSQRQRQMTKGVFPEWILEGKCETDKCFYRLYNCEEIKYTLKLLYRDPTKCNPLPSISNTTVFEERWELRPNYVVVGCNCVSPLIKNPKSKEQKKKMNLKN